MIPFCKVVLGEEEEAEVLDTMHSGWIGRGPKVAQFEKELAEYIGVRPERVVALNSCTSALHLSLLAYGVGPGDEVITTPLTFCATAHAIEYTGAKPVFADIDPETWNISPAAVEAAVTERTKAILPVHLYGLPCDMKELETITVHYVIPVIIEDAAHALGSKIRSKKIGHGHMTCFSFYPTKNVASPDGGAVVAESEWDARTVRGLSTFGLHTDAWARRSPDHYNEAEVIALGYKANWNDIAASIALAQLRAYPEALKRRRRIARKFLKVLAKFDVQVQPNDPGHAWHLVTFVLGESFPGNIYVIRALREAGLGAAMKYRPLHMEPYYKKKYGLLGSDFPVAYEVGRRLVTISPSPAMTNEEVGRACEILEEVLTECQTALTKS